LHGILLSGVRGQERTPGEFRRSQNWIGAPGCRINTATYVPPPPSELDRVLHEFERYLRAPSDLPPLVRHALIHYQFEAIHPFLDGNGRIGRLLITLLLCLDGILPGPLLFLSAFIERRRQDYYARLLGVSRSGDWESWIEFFLAGVNEQAADAVRRAGRLMSLRDLFRASLRSSGPSALPLQLAEELFASPAVSVAAVPAGVTAISAAQHRQAGRGRHSPLVTSTTWAGLWRTRSSRPWVAARPVSSPVPLKRGPDEQVGG
jgi:Fic family protein